MIAFVCFLRGVNMAGHNKVRMNDLSGMFREEGFEDAVTFIQSGNIIFTGPEGLSDKTLVTRIESAILKKFGLKIAAMVRKSDELSKILSANPFFGELDFNPSRSAVVFLHDSPGENEVRKILEVDYPPDKFEISGSEIYIFCPNGFGRTKLYTNFFEAKLKVEGTARNWNTVNAVLDIAHRKLQSE